MTPPGRCAKAKKLVTFVQKGKGKPATAYKKP